MVRLRPALGWLGQVFSWLVILGISAVVCAAVLVPRVGGATPYTILTGSMEPKLPPGTMVVIRPTPAAQIRVGDVVTYQLESGEPEVVTHRVVAIGTDGRGERRFTTQGDANDIPDAKAVMPVQIKGTLWYSVPHLGYVSRMIDGEERHLMLVAVVVFLFGYAAYMFSSDFRDRRRRARGARSEEA